MSTPAVFDLTGRVALITGGNGGIGRGIALGLAEAGAAVAIFGRNKEKNARVLAELKATGVPSMAIAVDVTNRAALEPAFRQVEAQLGPVDILVNNAGIATLSGGVLQESPESWDNVIETQLNAVFLLSKIAGQSMAARKRGKIINMGSMYSYFGSGLVPSYSAAKGAIIQLTKSMGDAILARTPAGRWGLPEELAGPAVFLASSASDFVTGETIRVDGGYAIC
jgi:2-deoxy-D-gluconate 3-dehydrogenase